MSIPANLSEKSPEQALQDLSASITRVQSAQDYTKIQQQLAAVLAQINQLPENHSLLERYQQVNQLFMSKQQVFADYQQALAAYSRQVKDIQEIIIDLGKIADVTDTYTLYHAITNILRRSDDARTILNDYADIGATEKIKLLRLAEIYSNYRKNSRELTNYIDNHNMLALYNYPDLINIITFAERIDPVARNENPLNTVAAKLMLQGKLSTTQLAGSAEDIKQTAVNFEWLEQCLQGKKETLPEQINSTSALPDVSKNYSVKHGREGAAYSLGRMFRFIESDIFDEAISELMQERKRQQLIQGLTDPVNLLEIENKGIQNATLKQLAMDNPSIRIKDENTIHSINQLAQDFVNGKTNYTQFKKSFQKLTSHILSAGTIQAIIQQHLPADLTESFKTISDKLSDVQAFLTEGNKYFSSVHKLNIIERILKKPQPSIINYTSDNSAAFSKNIQAAKVYFARFIEDADAFKQNTSKHVFQQFKTKAAQETGIIAQIYTKQLETRQQILKYSQNCLAVLEHTYRHLKHEIHSLSKQLDKSRKMNTDISRLTSTLAEKIQQLEKLAELTKAAQAAFPDHGLGKMGEKNYKNLRKLSENLARVIVTAETTLTVNPMRQSMPTIFEKIKNRFGGAHKVLQPSSIVDMPEIAADVAADHQQILNNYNALKDQRETIRAEIDECDNDTYPDEYADLVKKLHKLNVDLKTIEQEYPELLFSQDKIVQASELPAASQQSPNTKFRT